MGSTFSLGTWTRFDNFRHVFASEVGIDSSKPTMRTWFGGKTRSLLNSGKQKSSSNHHCSGVILNFRGGNMLKTNITKEHPHFQWEVHGSTSSNGWCSIVMLVFWGDTLLFASVEQLHIHFHSPALFQGCQGARCFSKERLGDTELKLTWTDPGRKT